MPYIRPLTLLNALFPQVSYQNPTSNPSMQKAFQGNKKPDFYTAPTIAT
jgi:hypothetical protein